MSFQEEEEENFCVFFFFPVIKFTRCKVNKKTNKQNETKMDEKIHREISQLDRKRDKESQSAKQRRWCARSVAVKYSILPAIIRYMAHGITVSNSGIKRNLNL